MEYKKILVFTDWYLPGYKAGGPIRSMANMVKSLKGKYQFYIVCRNTDYLESKPYRDIDSDSWNILSENESVYYISSEKLAIALIKKLISTRDIEMVYINGIYSFYFSILPLIFAKKHKLKKIIVAPRGMLSNQAYSSKKLKKKLFTKVCQVFGFYKQVFFHTTSAAENFDIQKLKLKPAGIAMLPNLPPAIDKTEFVKPEKHTGELRLVSIARISPEKNTLFALQTLKYCQYRGKINFDIYGPVYHKAYWKQCLEIISQIPENIKVSYKGELDNNKVINTLLAYQFFFLPTQGENFGHSILEGFLAACPAIISNKTPWKNLEEQKLGWDIELKHELFATILQKAIDLDNEKYRLLSESSHNFALHILENGELISDYKRFLG